MEKEIENIDDDFLSSAMKDDNVIVVVPGDEE